jgi:GNAT superfamily N-acetyltransferase
MDAPPNLSFRPGGRDDAATLARVLLEAFGTYRDWAHAGWSPSIDVSARERERLQARLGDSDYWCLVAEHGEEAAGYVILMPGFTRELRERIPGLAHIWHIFVRPAWWGSGVAARLMGKAVTEAGRRGYGEARLWTPRDNARARAFYRREGWRESGAERYAADVDLQLVEYRRPLHG